MKEMNRSEKIETVIGVITIIGIIIGVVMLLWGLLG